MAQLTRVTPKRLLTSSMIVGLLGTIGLASWHGAAESGGIPDAGDSTTPVRFRIQQGEEGVYSGQLSATMTAPKQGTITAQWKLKLTTLATDLNDQDKRRIAYLWLVDADEKNPKEVRGHADFGGQLSFAGIKTTDAHWTKWAQGMPPDAYLPAFPADKLALGQEWESPTPIIDSMVVTDMRWKVAAEETVAGRDCLRVDITPVQPLPSKLEERGSYEGGPPPEITLADLSKQHALLRNIQGNVWRGVDGAQAALPKIDAFREGHPDSPYMPALNVLEQSAHERIARSTPVEISPPEGRHLLGKKSPRFVGKATDGRTMTPKDFLGNPTVLVMMDTDLGTVVLDSKGIVRDHKYGFYPNRLDRLLAKMLKK